MADEYSTALHPEPRDRTDSETQTAPPDQSSEERGEIAREQCSVCEDQFSESHLSRLGLTELAVNVEEVEVALCRSCYRDLKSDGSH